MASWRFGLGLLFGGTQPKAPKPQNKWSNFTPRLTHKCIFCCQLEEGGYKTKVEIIDLLKNWHSSVSAPPLGLLPLSLVLVMVLSHDSSFLAYKNIEIRRL
jgi:hypothetical protein